MKRYLLISAAAAALTAAPMAASANECDVSMTSYDKEISANPENWQRVDAASRRNLRELRDAAAVLSRYGKTDACQEVVQAIKDIASDPEALERGRSAGAATMTGTSAAAGGNYEDRARMRAENAVPLSDAGASISASELIGADLHSAAGGEDLGSVDDLVLGKKGQMSYLIVAHGGFLGMGEKQIAIPFDAAKVSADGDTVYINASEESLEQAPSFDRDDRNWLKDEAWREKNDKYYMGLQR